jgi:hypothetical protein
MLGYGVMARSLGIVSAFVSWFCGWFGGPSCCTKGCYLHAVVVGVDFAAALHVLECALILHVPLSFTVAVLAGFGFVHEAQ